MRYAAAVAVLVPKKALVNGDMDTALGVQQGHHAALWIGIVCVVTALVWVGLCELGTHLPTPARRVGQATAVALVVVVIAAIALAHPVAKGVVGPAKKSVARCRGSLLWIGRHSPVPFGSSPSATRR